MYILIKKMFFAKDSGVIHMSENMENNIGLINAKMPKSVDKALTNLTEKPTKAIGSTLSDIWFLVFGGIGHLAEKRKLWYAADLEKYNKELQEKVNKIPKERKVAPDIQVVAPALEVSKYCVEKEELRKMFVNLIASSMDSDKITSVHPIFIDIISKLSSTDALLFKAIANESFDDNCIIFEASIEQISFSLTILEQLGLIVLKGNKENDESLKKNVINNHIRHYKNIVLNLSITNVAFDTLYEYVWDRITNFLLDKNLSGETFPQHEYVVNFFRETIKLTNLGKQFKNICL